MNHAFRVHNETTSNVIIEGLALVCAVSWETAANQLMYFLTIWNAPVIRVFRRMDKESKKCKV
jgi:uncharacterized protein YggT (Ycf19 family)